MVLLDLEGLVFGSTQVAQIRGVPKYFSGIFLTHASRVSSVITDGNSDMDGEEFTVIDTESCIYV